MTASRPQPSQTSQKSERVTVVRTLMDGTITREIMSAHEAALEMYSPQNGVTVRSMRIVFGTVRDRFGVSA